MTIRNEFTVDVEVDQTNNNLIAHVNLKTRGEIGVRYLFASDVRSELSRQGWQVSECVSNASLNNVSDNSLAAAWVFSLGKTTKEIEAEEVTVTNSVKPVTNSVKPVAVKENNIEQKKTTTRRRRTTKNDTKK